MVAEAGDNKQQDQGCTNYMASFVITIPKNDEHPNSCWTGLVMDVKSQVPVEWVLGHKQIGYDTRNAGTGMFAVLASMHRYPSFYV